MRVFLKILFYFHIVLSKPHVGSTEVSRWMYCKIAFSIALVTSDVYFFHLVFLQMDEWKTKIFQILSLINQNDIYW